MTVMPVGIGLFLPRPLPELSAAGEHAGQPLAYHGPADPSPVT
ncbi:hypothetical protein [Deinococcus indicus]|nr:hypothetical protein [Deinococcus indicus]